MSQPKYHHLTAIVLAGGRSTRMGIDKGLISLNGKPLIAHVIEAIEPLCSTILISTNKPEYEAFGYPLIADLYQGIGPMGGLHAGLLASKDVDNMLLSCDMPLVDAELLEALLAHRINYQAVIPVLDGQSFPICAYYNKSVLTMLDAEITAGLYKMKLFLKKLHALELQLDQNVFSHKMFNINTQQDFESLTKS